MTFETSELFKFPMELEATYAGQYPAEVPFYIDLIKAHCGTKTPLGVLEPCAGWGRIALPLAEAGVTVFATDIRQEMVDLLQERSRSRNAPLKVWQADMKTLSWTFEQKVDAAIIPLGIANRFTEMEDLIHHFQTMGNAVRNGGIGIWAVSAATNPRTLHNHEAIWTVHRNGQPLKTRFHVEPSLKPDPTVTTCLHQLYLPDREQPLELKSPHRIWTPRLIDAVESIIPDWNFVGWYSPFDINTLRPNPLDTDKFSVAVFKRT